MKKAPISISYRDEGLGKGPFFDHYTLRRATGHNTVISISQACDTTALQSANRNNTFSLDLGNEDDFSAFPATKQDGEVEGLLVIPGMARETETKRPTAYALRLAYEQEIIKRALLIGQPVLAICAGSWRLWEALGGSVEAIKGHNYSKMPFIVNSGNVGCNKQIHRIRFESDTMLASAMRVSDGQRPSVNSVHWKSVTGTAHFFRSAAFAVRDTTIEPNNRQGEAMDAEEGSIEAYESRFGAPIFGIQWHLEAYNQNDNAELMPSCHRRVLQYMALAGDAFAAKREMLKEFKVKLGSSNHR